MHRLLLLLLRRPAISRRRELSRGRLLHWRRVAALVTLIHAISHAAVTILMLHLLRLLLLLLMRLHVVPLWGLLAGVELVSLGHAIAVHGALLVSRVVLLSKLMVLLLRLLLLIAKPIMASAADAAGTTASIHLLLSLAGIALAGRERALLVCHDVVDMDEPKQNRDGDDETMQQSLMPPPSSRVCSSVWGKCVDLGGARCGFSGKCPGDSLPPKRNRSAWSSGRCRAGEIDGSW